MHMQHGGCQRCSRKCVALHNLGAHVAGGARERLKLRLILACPRVRLHVKIPSNPPVKSCAKGGANACLYATSRSRYRRQITRQTAASAPSACSGQERQIKHSWRRHTSLQQQCAPLTRPKSQSLRKGGRVAVMSALAGLMSRYTTLWSWLQQQHAYSPSKQWNSW
jgi:hypothetical protein